MKLTDLRTTILMNDSREGKAESKPVDVGVVGGEGRVDTGSGLQRMTWTAFSAMCAVIERRDG